MNRKALAIHGGAGTILRAEMTADMESEYRRGLEFALKQGWHVLDRGGAALEAVEAAVVELENFPLFNAGRGSVFTHDGKNEMDAAVMDGRSLNAGAVAFVKNVKNPVKLARLVMEKTDHILLAGDGANEFAREMNVEFEKDTYFFTEFRYQQLVEARRAGVVQLDHAAADKNKIGTVGAVACDSNGNLAAATSTGGMTNKKYGRIGDTPLIGAGTYAENATCAVSCTGHGEYFMLAQTAYDVAARMKYKLLSLADAARETLADLTRIGGEGGFIAVDAFGKIVMPFNSDGMYRASITEDGETTVDIYRGDNG
jgi:beta-aspartyl-peptidase (threonine type)